MLLAAASKSFSTSLTSVEDLVNLTLSDRGDSITSGLRSSLGAATLNTLLQFCNDYSIPVPDFSAMRQGKRRSNQDSTNKSQLDFTKEQLVEKLLIWVCSDVF